MKNLAFVLVSLAFTFSVWGCRNDAHDEEHAVVSAGNLSIWNVYAPEPVTGDVGSVYFSIRNDGESADEIVTVSADVAGHATLHDQRGESGMQAMVEVTRVPVPAGGTAVLEPGGLHMMLTEMKRAYREGDSIRVSVSFATGITLSFFVPVVSYDAVARRTDNPHEGRHP